MGGSWVHYYRRSGIMRGCYGNRVIVATVITINVFSFGVVFVFFSVDVSPVVSSSVVNSGGNTLSDTG